MSDIQSNIDINIGVGDSLANLRLLQREISGFYSSMAKGGAAANATSAQMQQNLVNAVNATGRFSASIKTISSTTETFTNALERNKFSMGEYFRFAGGATQRFGKLFASEMSTIDKVARERVKDLQTQYIRLGRDASGALKSIAVRPLTLDMGDLATKTAIAAQKQQIFNQLMKQGSTNLLNFGKNTQWAGRQLMVGFTIPLTIFGSIASKTFIELEKEIISFKKVYGDLLTTDIEADKAFEDIKALSTELAKYGASIKDTIGLAASAAAAGFQGEALMAQTREATRLSVLGQLEGQKALETTISLQNAFRISTEDLGDAINFLNAVENQTVVALDDVTTAIPRVAPVIQALGGDVKDLAFFLAAMKESGISAAQGANALKSGLASMINPSDKAAQALGSLGINIRGIVEAGKGDLRSTVLGFATALDTLDPLNRAKAIEQLFGKFQFARISALFDNVIREGSQASRVLDLAGESVENLSKLAGEELGVVSEATSTRFTAAMEGIKMAVAPIGEEFLKMIIPLIEFGTTALEAFNNIDDGIKQFVIGAIGLIGGIAPVAIMSFGLLANGVATAIKSFLFLRNRILGVGSSTDILGQQINYMTQEQIEASAVAASLGQTHSRLTQIFTSERDALDALAAAYTQAAIAGRSFSGPIIPAGAMRAGAQPTGYGSGKMPGYNSGKMPGYNRGVVMVPGSGNKDTEPAMLTPGEAVIPAPMAEKYASLISAMINDQIPGFDDGTVSVGGATVPVKSHRKSNFMTIQKTIDEFDPALQSLLRVIFETRENLVVSGASIERMRKELFSGMKDISSFERAHIAGRLPQETRKTMIDGAGLQGVVEPIEELLGRTVFQAVGNLTMDTPRIVNQLLKERGGMRVEDFESVMSNTKGALRSSGMRAGLDESYFDALDDIQTKVVERASQMARELGTGVTDAIITGEGLGVDENGERILGATEQVLSELASLQGNLSAAEESSKKAAQELQKLAADPGQLRAGVTFAEGEKLQKAGLATRSGESLVSTADPSVELYRDLGTRPGSPKRSTEAMGRAFPSYTSGDMMAELQQLELLQEFARKAGIQGVDNLIDGLKKGIEEALKINSPALVGEDGGKNFGLGVEMGFNSRVDDAQSSGEKLGSAILTGTESAIIGRAGATGMQTSKSGLLLPESKPNPSPTTESMLIASGAMSMVGSTPVVDNRAGTAVSKELEDLKKQESDASQGVASSNRNLTASISSLSYGITAMSGVFSMFGGEAAQASQAIFQFSSAISGVMFAFQSLESVTGKNILSGLLETRMSLAKAAMAKKEIVSTVSNTVATDANTSAKIKNTVATGAVAGGVKGFGAGLAALTRGVLAFLGPWGIAIGLASIAIMFLSSSIDEQIKKNRALSDATNFTAQSLKDLADRVGGTYTGSRLGFAGLAGVTEEEKSISESLASDEAFLSQYESQIEGFKNLDTEGLIFALDNLTKSLLAGGASPEEINSIVNAILTASGRASDQQYGMENVARVQSGGMQDFSSMISGINPEGMKVGLSRFFGDTDLTRFFGEGGARGYTQEGVNTTAQAIEALGAALATEQIEAEKFNEEFAKMSEIIMSIPADELNNIGVSFAGFSPGGDFMDQIIEQSALLDDSLKKQITSLGDAGDQLLVYKAILEGATEIDPEIFKLLDSGVEADQDEAVTRLNRAVEDGIEITKEANRVEEENIAIAERKAVIDEYSASISGKTEAIQNEIDAYNYLIDSGYTAEAALEAVADAQFNAAMAAAIAADAEAIASGAMESTANSAANLLAELNALREFEGKSPVIAARRAAASGGGRGGGGGRSGPEASMLDDLLVKMNRVVSATTKMTKGWADSRTMLDRLFGGSSTTGNFGGLEQQMRNLGAGEPLIDLIAGMPAEEFNKRKNELFTFDRSGNILRFRDSLVSIGEALRKIALGEFQNQQKATIRTFNDQMVAVNKLVAAGMSYAQAYDTAKDAALANAIANEKSSKAIQQIVKDAKAAEKALRDMAAAQAVAGKNEEFVDQQKLLQSLQKNAMGLSNDMIEAILEDQDLARLYLDPTIDPETLEKALNDVAVRKQIELEVKKLTIQGMEEIFQDGFGKAMEAFDAQEQKIELEFAIKKKPFEDAVKKAQELIADITDQEGGLDDLEADLERIGYQEEDINKKYDERKKALDSVKQINAAIAQQQKTQLTLADALSQGDIAGAARAAQEMREQMRQKAVEDQEKALDRAREAELGALIGNMGLTREQIESRIRDLKMQILEIEERMLEPAQRAIDLLDREQTALIESLTVLGRTRQEWELIKNQIDVARTSSDSYTKAIEAALGVVTDIVNYWDKLDGKQVETVHVIKTVYTTVGSPPAAPKAPITPSPESPGPVGPPRTDPPPPTQPKVLAPPAAMKSRYDKFMSSRVAMDSSKSKPIYDMLVGYNKLVGTTQHDGARLYMQAMDIALKKYGFNSGGIVPGTGNTDTVSAMLTPGEFVIRKPVVKKIGKKMLEKINRGEMSIPRFPSGSPIGDKMRAPYFRGEEDMLTKMPFLGGNNSAKHGQSVYNYDINVNVKSNADPDMIANVVVTKIRNIDSQRIRGSRIG